MAPPGPSPSTAHQRPVCVKMGDLLHVTFLAAAGSPSPTSPEPSTLALCPPPAGPTPQPVCLTAASGAWLEDASAVCLHSVGTSLTRRDPDLNTLPERVKVGDVVTVSGAGGSNAWMLDGRSDQLCWGDTGKGKDRRQAFVIAPPPSTESLPEYVGVNEEEGEREDAGGALRVGDAFVLVPVGGEGLESRRLVARIPGYKDMLRSPASVLGSSSSPSHSHRGIDPAAPPPPAASLSSPSSPPPPSRPVAERSPVYELCLRCGEKEGMDVGSEPPPSYPLFVRIASRLPAGASLPSIPPADPGALGVALPHPPSPSANPRHGEEQGSREGADSVVSVLFQQGDLGLSLARTPSGRARVLRLQPHTQADRNGIRAGDVIIQLNEDWDLSKQVLDSESWAAMVQYIKTSPRPLRLTVARKRPTPSRPSPPQPFLSDPSEGTDEQAGARTASPCATPSPRPPGAALCLPACPPGLRADPTSAPPSPARSSRKLLFRGPLRLWQEGRLWGGSWEERDAYLFSDAFVLAFPPSPPPSGGPLKAPAMEIDASWALATCKLREEGGKEGGEKVGVGRRDGGCFELVTPLRMYVLAAPSPSEREGWLAAIYAGMVALARMGMVGGGEGGQADVGMRHQLILDSLHAAVVYGKMDRVRALVGRREEEDKDGGGRGGEGGNGEGKGGGLPGEGGALPDRPLSQKSNDPSQAARLPPPSSGPRPGPHPSVLNRADEGGRTPLHYACLFRRHEMISLLLSRGADPTQADADGRLPLHLAALALDDTGVALLLSSSSSSPPSSSPSSSPFLPVHCLVNARDHDGRTPAFLATTSPRLACLSPGSGGEEENAEAFFALRRCLLALQVHEADLDMKDLEGRTAMHVASAAWRGGVVQVLGELGGEVDAFTRRRRREAALDVGSGNQEGEDGEEGEAGEEEEGEREAKTPLQWACSSGGRAWEARTEEEVAEAAQALEGTLRALLSMGAQPNRRSRRWTADGGGGGTMGSRAREGKTRGVGGKGREFGGRTAAELTLERTMALAQPGTETRRGEQRGGEEGNRGDGPASDTGDSSPPDLSDASPSAASVLSTRALALLVSFGARVDLSRSDKNTRSSSKSSLTDFLLPSQAPRGEQQRREDRQQRLQSAKAVWSAKKAPSAKDLSAEAMQRIAQKAWHRCHAGSLGLAGEGYLEREREGHGGVKEVEACLLCEESFNTLARRQHRCRLCALPVCGDCSSKRLPLGAYLGGGGREGGKGGGVETMVRVCDGCFNWGVYEMLKLRVSVGGERVHDRKEAKFVEAGAPQTREGAEERELFGQSREKSGGRGGLMNWLRKEANPAGQASRRATQGVMAAMGELRHGLQDRGERLESLADKTTELADSSAQFAEMAKQLNERYGGGGGWW